MLLTITRLWRRRSAREADCGQVLPDPLTAWSIGPENPYEEFIKL